MSLQKAIKRTNKGQSMIRLELDSFVRRQLLPNIGRDVDSIDITHIEVDPDNNWALVRYKVVGYMNQSSSWIRYKSIHVWHEIPINNVDTTTT